MGRRKPDSLFMAARREFERELLDRVIAESGNKMEASRRLGISYATLKTITKDKSTKVTGELAPLVAELKELVLRRVKGAPAKTDQLGDFIEKVRDEVRAEMVSNIRRSIDAPAPRGRGKRATS